MNPTDDFLDESNKLISKVLKDLRPKLLEVQGKIEHNLKDDKSAVTEMDLLVERRLEEKLHELDSGIGFSGEETGTDYNRETFWLVDPIDGTEPFIRGIPTATNMIALIDKGSPIMSVIYNFALDEYFLAVKGKGATRNGHPIHVSDRPIDRSFISVNRINLEMSAAIGLGDQIRKKWGKNITLFNSGGTGYSLCAVASGSIEARVALKSLSSPWDYAPGILLVQEAGGKAANIGSDTYDFQNTDLVASNSVVFDDLMGFMEEIAKIDGIE